MKKIKIPSEIIYVLAIVLLTLAVAMTAASDFGVSMVVAPAYILFLKFPVMTFGTYTYLVEGLIFIVFCILMKKIRLPYFFAFITSVIYGFVLDFWRAVVPLFNSNITAPGSMDLPIRILLFIVGVLLTAFSVALFFRTYIPPQVIDLFVKGVAEKYKLNRTKFKMIIDASLLTISVVMSLLFFGKLNGIHIGTVIIAAVNGVLIGLFGKLIDKTIEIKPLFKKGEEIFRL